MMNILLPDALKSFVDEQVSERGYSTSSEYVRELIRKDQDLEAIERVQRQQFHRDAVERIVSRRAGAPTVSESQFNAARRKPPLLICVVDASVAVKWFVSAVWALREDHLEPALNVLRASSEGAVEL